jgi:hypothetical protein
MSSNNLFRIAAVLVSVFAIGGFAMAEDPSCLEACADQFADDYQVCVDEYNEAVAQAEAEYQECLEGATGFLDRLRCSTERRGAISRAEAERRACINLAETEYASCVIECSQSPSAPSIPTAGESYRVVGPR